MFGFHSQMCLAIRYFATGSNYSVVGDFQGVTKATVSNCVREVAAFLYAKQRDYIIFPTTYQQRVEVARGFYDRFGEKPYCMGCVDGTHVPILRPHGNEYTYVNRKGYPSLNVMVGNL